MSVVDDWALLEFASVVDGVTCAIEIQRQIRERDGSKAGWCIGVCIGMSARERLSVIFTMLNGPLAIDVRERDLPSPRAKCVLTPNRCPCGQLRRIGSQGCCQQKCLQRTTRHRFLGKRIALRLAKA